MIESNVSISDSYQMNGVQLEKAESKKVRSSIQDNQQLSSLLPHGKSLSPRISADQSKGHLYHKNLSDEHIRHRPRYQRRNSAVASMLFPSISKQLPVRTSTASTTRQQPLYLTHSLRNIDPLEALDHARKVLDCIADPDHQNSGDSHHDSHESHDNLPGLTLGKREKTPDEDDAQRSLKKQRVET